MLLLIKDKLKRTKHPLKPSISPGEKPWLPSNEHVALLRPTWELTVLNRNFHPDVKNYYRLFHLHQWPLMLTIKRCIRESTFRVHSLPHVKFGSIML